MRNGFRLPLLGLSALMVGGCSGDRGDSPSIVGSWVAVSWRETSVADTSRSRNDLTDTGLLTLTFVASASGAFTWTLAFPIDTQQVSGTYTLRDSTLTFSYVGEPNTTFTATLAASTLVIWEPDTVDLGRGREVARNVFTFKRE